MASVMTYKDLKLKGIVPLPVCHIHTSVRKTKPYVYNTYLNHPFKRTRIIGTVTDKKLNNNGNLCLTIDDGTAEILCIIVKKDIADMNNKKVRVEKKLGDLLKIKSEIDNFGSEHDALFNNGTIILLNKFTEQIEKRGINIEDYELDSCVSVIGNVGDLYGRKVIYVSTVRKIDTLHEPFERQRHLQACKDFVRLLDEKVSLGNK